ncbi:putative tRNA-specific adenosine deaminase [Rhypophila decipiens]|uniref:tRNA-specific adenosine deaminase n=1 Tax=Rhypophila decipiens TaxID=261697 RepID=A0AAN6YDJ3_9PEZI|nr:putative tRNA-specific adenosine deaminase [Rhypophila decipiens]
MAPFPPLFSAIGRRFTTYFHSFLLFFTGGFGRNLMTFFLSFRRQGDQGGTGLLQSSVAAQNVQTLPSRVRAALEEEEGNTTTNTATSTTALSSSEAEEDQSLQQQATDADDERDINDLNDLNYFYDTDDEMVGKSLPKIPPALPLKPPQPRRKESTNALKGSLTKKESDLSGLNDGLSRMQLDGQLAALTEKRLLEGGNAAVLGQAPPSLQTITNRSTPITKETASVVDTRGKGKEPANAPNENAPLSTPQEEAKREVVRSPPVPLIHDVSQSSNLKEIAANLNTPISITEIAPIIRAPDPEETPEQAAERMLHSGFMRDALDMARLALKTNETPVGCVLVYKNRIIAKGMNATNITRNGTRHAELMAISALLSYTKADDYEVKKEPSAKGKKSGKGKQPETSQPDPDVSEWGDVDPKDGHIYPYGQKLHPAPRVSRDIINECVLYVTVEPCIMCASLLRQLGIKKVYFGAVNDKFGGTGGVFRIHKNSPHVAASCPPSPMPQNGKGFARPALGRPVSTSNIPYSQASCSSGDEKSETNAEPPVDPATLPGDGGNVERGYDVEGGWGRDEAVTLLRQFYVQENGRAPVPRKKEGRAARLAAMMERDGHAGGPMIDASVIQPKTVGENGEEISDSAADEGGGGSSSSGASDDGVTNAAE